MQLDRIGQIALTVRDLAEAKRFYGETLGMKFLFDAGTMAFYQCGDIRLMIGLGGKAGDCRKAVAGRGRFFTSAWRRLRRSARLLKGAGCGVDARRSSDREDAGPRSVDGVCERPERECAGVDERSADSQPVRDDDPLASYDLRAGLAARPLRRLCFIWKRRRARCSSLGADALVLQRAAGGVWPRAGVAEWLHPDRPESARRFAD